MVNVQIQTSSYCNAKCVFCPYPESWHKANPGIMSKRRFTHVIRQISHVEVGKLCLYLQNEPFLDPLLFDRIKHVKDNLKFGHIELSTNASVYNRDVSNE